MDDRWDGGSRRAVGAVLAAAVAVLTLALPAVAAVSHTVESPGNGATVNQSTPVRVVTQREVLDPPVRTVEARLSGDGQSIYPGTQPVALRCLEGCGDNDTRTVWGDVALDPTSPRGFFPGSPPPMCNGAWRVQPRLDGGAWAAGVTVLVSRPPSAVPAPDLDPGVETVDVSWAAAPEPDISGYRLERRQVGASYWTTLGDFAPDRRAYEDDGVGPGDYQYRVITYRPDGKSGGNGTAPCTDADQALSSTSEARTTTVGARPSPSPTPSPRRGGSTGGEDGTAGGDEGSSGTGGDDGDGGSGTSGTGGDAGTSGGSTRRVAPPPPPVRSGPDLSAPELPRPEVAEPEERFFGEGEAFDELLDYGDAGDDPNSDSEVELGGEGDTIEVGGFASSITRIFNSDRVVRFMAASLVLFVLALHVVRWMRDGDVA